jgi:Fe-S-cluster containining protein
VDLNLATALSTVKVAMKEVADKSTIRRLHMYTDIIKCKPACSACCNRQIYLTIAEALIIQEHLERSGKWEEVEKRARAVMTLARDTEPVSWFKMNIMCPVLDPSTKLCTAYETRPSPCSTHFVKSDPEQCDPWSVKSGKYEAIDFKDLHNKFRKFLEKSVDGYGILALKFPMSVALVFAARVKIQSAKGPNEIMSIIFNEL